MSHNVGESNPRAKLTRSQVDEFNKTFRPLIEAGKLTQLAVSRLLGINPVAINHLYTGRTWKKKAPDTVEAARGPVLSSLSDTLNHWEGSPCPKP